jgi:ferredoxin
MRHPFLASEAPLSRREFFKAVRFKNVFNPVVDKEKCTGCSLCAVHCPTGALVLLQNAEIKLIRILFRQDLCDGCGRCETLCPEHCFQLQRGSKRNKRDAASRILFEDRILQCHGCGASLFPEALVERLRTRVPSMEGIGTLFDLCPSCRMKTQRAGERVEKSK